MPTICPNPQPLSITTLLLTDPFTRFSARHTGMGDIAFSDGHSASYKYEYVCYDDGSKPADPGRADINWSYDGHAVP